MALNIGISGFGGLGRQVFLRLLNDKNITVTAINDTAKPELLVYRLKYDTMAGRAPFADAVRPGAGFIGIKGREIPVLGERDPAKIPWKKLKTDLVLECGGLSRRQAAAHIRAGAKQVLLSGGDDPPFIVFGENEKTLGPEDHIIAAAGPLLSSLVLIAGALHAGTPIRSAFFTAVQAGDCPEESRRPPAGAPPRNRFRCFRSAAADLVPGCSGAAAAAGLVIPDLRGRLAGAVLRSPAAGGSLLILNAAVHTEAPLDAETVNRAFKAKANKILGYNDEEIVSSDAADMEYAALFDATQTLVLPRGEDGLYQVQAAAWYDQKSSAAVQLIRIIRRLSGEKPGGKAGKRSAGRSAADRIGGMPLHRKPLINYQR
jgi:glyceraldehyde 3-phosphate dehydrogenase